MSFRTVPDQIISQSTTPATFEPKSKGDFP